MCIWVKFLSSFILLQLVLYAITFTIGKLLDLPRGYLSIIFCYMASVGTISYLIGIWNWDKKRRQSK